MPSKSSELSWRISASKSTFSVKLPLTFDEGGLTCAAPVKERNMHACGRCANMRKKCNMSPPYSTAKCEECTRAGVEPCPPHRPRRNRRKHVHLHSGQATLSIPVVAVGDMTSITLSQLTPHSSSAAIKNLYEPSRAPVNEAQLMEPSKLGLCSPNNMINDGTGVEVGALDIFLAEVGLSPGDDWAGSLLGAQEPSRDFDCRAWRVSLPREHNVGQPSSSVLQASTTA